MALFLSFAASSSMLLACDTTSPGGVKPPDRPEIEGRTPLALVEDRKVTVTYVHYQNGQKTEVQDLVTVHEFHGDTVIEYPDLNPLLEGLAEACDIAAFDPPELWDCRWDPAGAAARTACEGNIRLEATEVHSDLPAMTAALRYTCMGHYALTLAEATTPYYLRPADYQDDDTWSGLLKEKPDLHSDGATEAYRVDPSSPSDRASWALLAAELFREAIAAGTLALEKCNASAFVRFCEDGTEDGIKIRMGTQMAITIGDASSSAIEAAEKAAKYLHASALARNATKGDRSRRRKIAWRDPYDSLLRAASPYVDIPDFLYNNGDNLDGEYPVVTALATTDADRRAEQLLRDHQVDPRRSSGRTIADIANDLIFSLNSQYNDAYQDYGGAGLAFLETQGIDQADFERAALRLRQEALVLGRTITPYVDDPDGDDGPLPAVNRVWGLEKVPTQVNPAYLYAITETAEVAGLSDGTPDIHYARQGIFHTFDYFLQHLPGILEVEGRPIALLNGLQNAEAYIRSQVQGRIIVRAGSEGDGAPPYADVRVIEGDTVFHGSADSEYITIFREKYDFWLGEAGLACALSKTTASGAPCDAEAVESYRFNEDAGVVWAPNSDPGKSNPPFRLDASSAPVGNSNFLNGAGAPPRVYVTRRIDTNQDGVLQPEEQDRTVLGGFSIVLPPSGTQYYAFPISSGLMEALSQTLAVDPLAPDETAYLCGKNGLPRNIKLGLEDELLQAQGVNGSNTVEESWSYYLSLAQSASEEADLLGSELVDRGLEMDMRAEDAREELEDLCGGVVNVPDIRSQVCDMPTANGRTKCDIQAFLSIPENEAIEGVAQLKQCLGLESTANAALGSDPVCMWQWEGLPPCQCPKSEGIISQSRLNCPSRGASAAMCPKPAIGKQTATPNDCEKMFVQPVLPRTTPGPVNQIFPDFIKFTAFNDRLGLVPKTDKEKDPPPPDACRALSEAREHYASSHDGNFGWNRKKLAAVASRLGVDRGSLNLPVITLDGAPWLTTGRYSGESNPNPWQAKTEESGFPCGPIESVDCTQLNQSLACRLRCGSDGDLAEMATARKSTGETLAAAVELLRSITRTGFEGVEIAGTRANFEQSLSGDKVALTKSSPWEGTGVSVDRAFLEYTFGPSVDAGSAHVGIYRTLTNPAKKAAARSLRIDYDQANIGTDALPIPDDQETVITDMGAFSSWPALEQDQSDELWAKVKFSEYVYAPAQWEKFKKGIKASGLPTVFGQGGFSRNSPAVRQYEVDVLLDALELACIAVSPDMAPAQNCDLSHLEINASGVSDIQRAKGMLECRARQIAMATSSFVLADAPATLVQQMKGSGVANIYPTHAGASAQSVNDLHRSLQQIAAYMIDLSEQTRSAGLDLELLESELAGLDYRKQANVESAAKELSALHDQCTMATTNAAFSAAASLAGAVGLNTISNPGQGAAAAIAATGAIVGAQQQCASGKTQASHAKALQGLANAEVDELQKQAVTRAADQMVKHQASVEKTWKALLIAYGDAQAAIAALESHRNAAHRAAAKVLMLDNDDVGHVFAVNTAMRARFSTLRVRYERARDYAVRMNYLARRAIEQKIGMELPLLTEDVGWVPAPATWADTICSLTGIDYSKVRAGGDKENAEDEEEEDEQEEEYTYAEQYVGEYTHRLKEFMTAYVNTYASHDADDVAVVSVRDELLGVRAVECSAEGSNALLQSYRSVNEALPLLAGGRSVEEANGGVSEEIWRTTCTSQGECAKVEPIDLATQGCTLIERVDQDPETPPSTSQTATTPFISYGKNEDGESVPAENECDGEQIIAASDPPPAKFRGVRAVRLSSVQSTPGSSGLPDEPPTEPPTDNLQFWYDGEHCDAVTATRVDCQDRSAFGRGATTYVGTTAARIVTAGIGGRPTIELTNGWLSNTQLNPSQRFTVTAAYRLTGSNSAYLVYNAGVDAGDGTRPEGIVWLNRYAAQNHFQWKRDTSVLNTEVGYLGARVPINPGAASHVQDGSIITVVSDGPNGARMYSNGKLVATTDHPIPAIRLGGTFLRPVQTGQIVQAAEILAYNTALSEEQITQLHGYLAARYGIDQRGPTSWIDGDDLARMAANGGSSTVSGHTAPVGSIYDRTLSYSHGALTATSATLTDFDGSHTAIRIPQGTAGLYLSAPVLNFYRAAGGVDEYRYASHGVTDRVLTMIGKFEQLGTVISLLGSQHSTEGYSTPSVRVKPDGKLELQLTHQPGSVPTFHATADENYGTLAANTPFILSLRMHNTPDNSAGRTDVFLNGRNILTVGEPSQITTQRITGSTTSAVLVAEYLVHTLSMSDEDVAALHQTLADKYAIGLNPIAEPPPPEMTERPGYEQTVTLPSGTHLLSWYDTGDHYDLEPVVRDADGSSVELWDGGGVIVASLGEERWLAPGWTRRWRRFTGGGQLTVGWELANVSADGIMFAAPQIEAVEPNFNDYPSSFWPTDDDRYSPYGVCEDGDGSVFRAERWSTGCETYCPANLPDCARSVTDPNKLPKRCYHELKFHLSQADIDEGSLIPQGGFASGNFNYRWEEIAVNVVGTAIKDCSKSELPSACYANNFLQYSLRHDGPFTVRNYLGRSYDAPLYPGRIQQGKALLAERYLTNPLSGADRGLLTDFWDYEFVGRPLEGNYTLRVYDTDGFVWDRGALEDIQLVMHYRYWTRAN
jgi:hypothetical protein